MSISRDPAPRKIAGGKPCPKCSINMQRFEHSIGWSPQPGRNFYAYWDRCLPCGHFQNYPEAHVKVAA